MMPKARIQPRSHRRNEPNNVAAMNGVGPVLRGRLVAPSGLE
jgi:hypothetical protein